MLSAVASSRCGAIAKGENVIKYGLPIGHALADIAPGEHVHAHNTRTNLSDLDAYRYQPDLVEQPAQPADRDVEIYRRASGEVGVRVTNYGSCRPWAVLTASPGRSRIVS